MHPHLLLPATWKSFPLPLPPNARLQLWRLQGAGPRTHQASMPKGWLWGAFASHSATPWRPTTASPITTGYTQQSITPSLVPQRPLMESMTLARWSADTVRGPTLVPSGHPLGQLTDFSITREFSQSLISREV